VQTGQVCVSKLNFPSQERFGQYCQVFRLQDGQKGECRLILAPQNWQDNCSTFAKNWPSWENTNSTPQ